LFSFEAIPQQKTFGGLALPGPLGELKELEEGGEKGRQVGNLVW